MTDKEGESVNPAAERIKYIPAVVLYGTIGLFPRFVVLPSEIAALIIGAAAASECMGEKKGERGFFGKKPCKKL